MRLRFGSFGRVSRVPVLVPIVLAVASVAAFLLIGQGGGSARAADHLDSPTVKTDGRTDIGDLYVFHPVSTVGGSQDLSATVFAMTVNPAAGVISGTAFRPGARYEFVVDRFGLVNGGQAIEVAMGEQNGSGQVGTAVLRESGDKTVVTISVEPSPTGATQPAHIHKPQDCATPGGVEFPLKDVVNGRSVTTVNAKLSDILSQARLVHIHKSKTEASIYTSCGELAKATKIVPSDVEDFVYRVRVVGDIVLAFRVQKGVERLIAVGNTSTTIVGLEPGVRVFAGLTDDPFFLDLNAFNAGAKFCQGTGGTGSNFFKGFNSSSIVLMVPTKSIGVDQIGVWAQTMTSGADGAYTRVDRMGRPAINTVFIPDNPFEARPSLEDKFNAGHPRDDQKNWRAEVVDSLALLHSLNDASDDKSDDAKKVEGLADVLLPDVLTVDLSTTTSFLNGRNLSDDVIDAELGLITEGAVTTDCVANDSTFSTNFPYLGKAN